MREDLQALVTCAHEPSPDQPSPPNFFGQRFRWAAAIGGAVITAMLLSIPIARLVNPAPRNLVSAADARRVAELAAEKQLSVPAFHISSLAEDVPDTARRLSGLGQRHRLALLGPAIHGDLTSVNKNGNVSAYLVNGTLQAAQSCAGAGLRGPLQGVHQRRLAALRRLCRMYIGSLNRDGRMELRLTYQDGATAMVTLKPIWVLPNDPEPSRGWRNARHPRGSGPAPLAGRSAFSHRYIRPITLARRTVSYSGQSRAPMFAERIHAALQLVTDSDDCYASTGGQGSQHGCRLFRAKRV